MIKNLFNMLIAFLMYPFFKNEKEIWLVGGNAGELYVDNARAMHEYLLEKENLDVYFVLNEDAVFRNDFDKNNIKYLIKGSIKSYLYFMKSTVSLFSHSISADIVPYLCVVPIISYFHKKNYKVFLNHGTVGLKKRIAMNKKYEKQIEKLLKSYDLNPCDSEFEKNIKVFDWNMNEETMLVCGYPRYDRLYNLKTEDVKDILYMPTWRKYETNGINEFLESEKLANYLESNNIFMRVYIHQLYKGKLEKQKLSKNIVFLDKKTDVTKELLNAKILITDYSSVCYDFYYLNKKVVFYQFDKEKYLKEFGSYVDLDNFFSRSNTSIDEVLEDLTFEKTSSNDYFKYIDNKNRERLYNEIIKRKKEKHNG